MQVRVRVFTCRFVEVRLYVQGICFVRGIRWSLRRIVCFNCGFSEYGADTPTLWDGSLQSAMKGV